MSTHPRSRQRASRALTQISSCLTHTLVLTLCMALVQAAPPLMHGVYHRPAIYIHRGLSNPCAGIDESHSFPWPSDIRNDGHGDTGHQHNPNCCAICIATLNISSGYVPDLGNALWFNLEPREHCSQEDQSIDTVFLFRRPFSRAPPINL